MSRHEYLSPEGVSVRGSGICAGLRLDGRRAHELRTLSAQLGVLPQVDGSALFALGNTRVLATVYGPREVRARVRR